jgi:Rieske Fe-S protein
MPRTRRAFVRGSARALVSAVATTILAPLVEACGRGDDRSGGSGGSGDAPLFEESFDVGGLTENGQALVTARPGFDGAPILIERRSARVYVALSMQCTHEGCPVKPPARGIIQCPCHGSQYDLDGKVVHGPAQFPLARYDTAFSRWSKRLTVRRNA